MTNSGHLDRTITIERFSTTKNEFNEEVQTWAPFVTISAQRKDTSDLVKTEMLGAEQVGSFLLSHFVVRSSTRTKTISPIDRINYDGHLWNIKGTKETTEGRNRFIEITAVRANNG
ncbi:head-tail adaptor protein [Mesorhizobium retamae]|uniref:Head-tail adaptor protein n=1 Tax=Mesorhizobium retamae TaxID=2912854 RepID=A0ABS9QQP2_9HYPH|nr:head-tail adaptor protein [Mesorhizobium sp. IRAMC:0171]MCG7508874.1 head-tail adaptor protein [Mesorhizobium sp. IRAMC:0171]